jgi:hypothetical protein
MEMTDVLQWTAFLALAASVLMLGITCLRMNKRLQSLEKVASEMHSVGETQKHVIESLQTLRTCNAAVRDMSVKVESQQKKLSEYHDAVRKLVLGVKGLKRPGKIKEFEIDEEVLRLMIRNEMNRIPMGTTMRKLK